MENIFSVNVKKKSLLKFDFKNLVFFMLALTVFRMAFDWVDTWLASFMMSDIE